MTAVANSLTLQTVMGCLISCCCGGEDGEEGGRGAGERTRLLSECNSQTQVLTVTQELWLYSHAIPAVS